MIRVIPKWRVTVKLYSHDKEDVVFWISDDHMANVLRTVASMDFTMNALEHPKSIVIDGPEQ